MPSVNGQVGSHLRHCTHESIDDEGHTAVYLSCPRDETWLLLQEAVNRAEQYQTQKQVLLGELSFPPGFDPDEYGLELDWGEPPPFVFYEEGEYVPDEEPF